MDVKDRYDSLITYYAEAQGLPFALVKAQMLAESNAKPNAVSRVGAKGLMQFMPETWTDIAGHDADPHNPELSIEAGCRYLRRLLDQFNQNTPAALAAYNWGMGNVNRHLKQYGGILNDARLPEETRNYLTRIARKRGEIEGVVAHA